MGKFSKSFIVSQKDTAKMIGSGDLDVLATPVLITMVENTAKNFLAKELTSEETSVGTMINAKHLRPSKVGAKISVHIKVETREKSKVDFSFEVLDNECVVASGTHQRAVILTDVFLSKLALSK
ncbi:thioesterase family protein [Enterococcus wangshanyuanii]|uniref:Thioesterase n=1 Tax=Enterococcus wangshanyuanii TaxID=2005703 RepID=A0ABQ1NRH5_9ENTE|nr:hotdog domain-containing protein [Enterococcus wangshanyuanii]GGC81116.1 thioesterase [Enterococcus wangshanyuanii]